MMILATTLAKFIISSKRAPSAERHERGISMSRSQSKQTEAQIREPAEAEGTGVRDPFILQEIEFMPSGLETIDFAVYDYLNERLGLGTTSYKGFQKAPIIWASSERAFQLKANKDLRDKDETLIKELSRMLTFPKPMTLRAARSPLLAELIRKRRLNFKIIFRDASS